MKTLRGKFFPVVAAIFVFAMCPNLVLGQGWQLTTSYPLNGFQFGADESGGRIYVGGGYNGVAFSNVLFSAVNGDGSLGAWSATTALPETDAGPGLAINDGWAYVALGSGATYRAQILPGGGVGNWIAAPSVETSTSYN